MTNSVTQTFSLTNEILQVLDEICKDTGMKRSAVVQELILKAGKDEKTREIIYLEHCKRSLRKKTGGETSDNVHCVNEKKADPEPYQDQQDPGKGPLTLSHDEFGIVNKPTLEEALDILEKCKGIWQQEN